MKNKSGQLGSILSTFIATVVIVIILLIFILLSGLVKTFGDVSGETRIYDEGEIGLGNLLDSMLSYRFVLDKRFSIQKQGGVVSYYESQNE